MIPRTEPRIYEGIDNRGNVVKDQYYHDGKRAYILSETKSDNDNKVAYGNELVIKAYWVSEESIKLIEDVTP